MSRNLRIPLFGALTLVVLCFLCYVAFFSGDDASESQETTAEATEEPNPRQALQDKLNNLKKPAPITPVGNTITGTEGVKAATLAPNASTPKPTDQVEAAPSESGESDKTETIAGKQQPGTPGSVIEYTISKGDMISKIAVRFGCKSSDIYELNSNINSKNAHKIRVGQKIKVLDNKGIGGGTLVKADPKSASSPQVVDAPVKKQEDTVVYREPVSAPSFNKSKSHTLEKNDGYFTLSVKYYNTPALWRLIKDANPDWDPFNFEPGQEIVIPALEPEGVVEAPSRNKAGLPFEKR